MLSKKTEYIVSAVLALYIVFLTRPALPAITFVLSSPIAQVAALGAVIYVGAQVSIVVAIMLGIALVFSTPSREHLENPEPKATPKAMKKAPKKMDTKKMDSEIKKMGAAATKPMKAPQKEAEPVEPAGQKMESKTPTTAENFSLMNAADF
jgi:predicted RND superfamily exporter protein